jgi:hypothetical protein
VKEGVAVVEKSIKDKCNKTNSNAPFMSQKAWVSPTPCLPFFADANHRARQYRKTSNE